MYKLPNVKNSKNWTMDEVHKRIKWIQRDSNIMRSILNSHIKIIKFD